MFQATQAIGRNLAADFNDEFLFQLVGVFAHPSQQARVLGQHQQAAGLALQWHHGDQVIEMALEHADAGVVALPATFGFQQSRGGIAAFLGVEVLRFVQDDGRRFGRRELRAFIDFDNVLVHLELRFLDHFAVHAHPATQDGLLGFLARAGQQFGDALGKADRFGHGVATWGDGAV